MEIKVGEESNVLFRGRTLEDLSEGCEPLK